MGEEIFIWDDGSWMYVSDYCEEVEKWRGFDFRRLSGDDYLFDENGDLHEKEWE